LSDRAKDCELVSLIEGYRHGHSRSVTVTGDLLVVTCLLES